MPSDLYGYARALILGLNRAVAPRSEGSKTWMIGGPLRAFLHSDDKGNQIVELAFTLPILLSMVMGAYSISMGLYVHEQLGQAVFVASQTVQNGRSIVTDPCATAAQSVADALPTWPQAKFTYTLTLYTTGTKSKVYGPKAGQEAFTCPDLAASMTENQQGILKVDYLYTWIPVYLWNIGTTTISQSRAVMVE
jgi:Flp pilus assembly protein TadG